MRLRAPHAVEVEKRLREKAEPWEDIRKAGLQGCRLWGLGLGTQRAQDPFIKEYTLNNKGVHIMI